MATTKRERKAKVKQEEIETPPPIPEAPKDMLLPDHLLKLEVISRDIQIAQLSMAGEEQSLANMLLSLENLQSKIERQRLIVSTKAQKYEDMKKKFTAYKKEIWPEYGIELDKPLPYDPNTGEIKRN